MRGDANSLIQFRSTLPRGERRADGDRWPDCYYGFDPRSREGSDSWSRMPRPFQRCFDPRSREGSDSILGRVLPASRWFRSTLPRGERPAQVCLVCQLGQFRSTLPRGERRELAVRFDPAAPDVSIHAPARGATQRRPELRISFNVSIHAPARGATKLCLHGLILDFTFRSTLPRGERQHHDDAAHGYTRFRSTLPRGERQESAVARGVFQSFDPRSREGSDTGIVRLCKILLTVSIHAPARGATLDLLAAACIARVSIHAPARGATRVMHFR